MMIWQLARLALIAFRIKIVKFKKYEVQYRPTYKYVLVCMDKQAKYVCVHTVCVHCVLCVLVCVCSVCKKVHNNGATSPEAYTQT